MAYIKAISYFLPETVLTNEQLSKLFPEWTTEKIASKVGISQRHIAAPDQTAGDMAFMAAKKLFSEHNIDVASIDFLILCTQNADYNMPATACILQDKLGLPTSCGAFDIDLGCSGFVYGLAVAKGLVDAHIAKNVLLLTADTLTKHVHPEDKGNLTIFGDAATATLISDTGKAEILNFSLGTDGSGWDNLIVKTAYARNPEKTGIVNYDESGNPYSDDYFHMNGKAVFDFTSESVPPMVEDALSKNKLSMDDISLFVFHQANKYMINYLRKILEIPKDNFYVYMEKVGNTVASSIPIALYHAEKEQKASGDVLIAGFGVGFSWGATVLRYTE